MRRAARDPVLKELGDFVVARAMEGRGFSWDIEGRDVVVRRHGIELARKPVGDGFASCAEAIFDAYHDVIGIASASR